MRNTHKQRYQLLLGLLSIFLISITFGGCEAEKDFGNDSRVGKVSYVKISDVPFLIPTIQEYNHSYDYLSDPSLSKANSKMTNLNLDLENIVEYVYANGLKTYSIKINKELEEFEDKYFENLHIYKREIDYKYFIAKYNEIDDTKIFDITTFTGDLEIYDSDYVYQGVAKFRNGVRECHKFPVGGWRVWIHNGTVDVWFVEDADASSGSNNNNDSDASEYVFIATAGPAIGENNGGGINTALAGPCQTLRDLANPEIGNIRPEIDSLKAKVENDETNTTEWSVSIKKAMNQDQTFTYTKTIAQGDATSAPISLESQSNIGGAHSHPGNGHDIPSWGDVMALRDAFRNAFPSRQPEVTIMTVCKDNFTGEAIVYAILVDNYNALDIAVEARWNGSTYGSIADEKLRLKKILKDQGLEYDKHLQELEKSFLQQFSSYGISLFKATNEDLTAWEKLDLNADPSLPIGSQLTVQRTPCN